MRIRIRSTYNNGFDRSSPRLAGHPLPIFPDVSLLFVAYYARHAQTRWPEELFILTIPAAL